MKFQEGEFLSDASGWSIAEWEVLTRVFLPILRGESEWVEGEGIFPISRVSMDVVDDADKVGL